METKTFKTLVKSEHALGRVSFVFGRIMGAMAVICKEDPANGVESGYGILENGDRIIIAKTTDEKYEAFTKVIESWYKGLCIFNYVE